MAGLRPLSDKSRDSDTLLTHQKVAKIVLFGEVCGTCQWKPDGLEVKSLSAELSGNSLTRTMRTLVLTTAWG